MLALLRKRVRRKADRAFTIYARARFRMLEAKAERGLFNNRCHANCVQYLHERPERTSLQIVEVVSIENGSPFIHYLVHDPLENSYMDVTLGWQTTDIEHYFVRVVAPSDFRFIGDELTRSQTYWHERFVPAWWRWLFSRPIF